LRILIANRRLSNRTGTEIVTRDLALALRSLGHDVVVYSPVVGQLAREIRLAGVPVCRDIRRVEVPPDVLHGNHPKALLDALVRFPRVPAVSVCHDATSERDEPVFHPRIFRYVGVDERCLQRLLTSTRIPRHLTGMHLNAVDLGRFRSRRRLPDRPARALVFSNYASSRTHLPAVRAACETASLSLDVIGQLAGRSSPRPEEALGQYDVVFAKARCALEAMAVGAAVVLCDAVGLGPMVTSADFDRVRRMNFGQGLLLQSVTPQAIEVELGRYDAADAELVSAKVRSEASLDRSVLVWCESYRSVADEARLTREDLPGEQAALTEVAGRVRREARLERAERCALWFSAMPLAERAVEGLARRLVCALST
jgi:hypothetical protein